ncbi:MAG: type II/IV secretion system protein [Gammaproteobacteria bacterium]|nr:type II/IV secretion system protein [Gammaproteobacteria bacterium]
MSKLAAIDDNNFPLVDPVSGKLVLDEILLALLADGLIESENADLLTSLSKTPERKKQNALEVIARSNWTSKRNPKQAIDLEFLVQWLSTKIGIPAKRIDPLKVEVSKVTKVISYAYASRYRIIPLEVTPNAVTFGTAEPFLREWEDELSPILKKDINRVICNPDDIDRFLLEFYSLSRSVLGAENDQARAAGSSAMQNLEQLMELGRSGKLDANDQHVVNIVDWLLQYAFEQRASDIHLEPRREQGQVRFRIDGVMHDVYAMPAPVMMAVTSRMKILGRMDVAEKRRPQDGRLKTRNPDGKEVELRLSTMPIAFGEKMVMRIFDPDVLVKDQEQLGFDQREASIWNRMIKQPHGILLVTGPTGSGKTTTLYSSLQRLAVPEVNVCTVEDPIELVVPAFNQMQVQHNIDLDFAAGIRTLLRQDPDIIMIGEIRDYETAQMAVQAALTGHLVLSTLHTNDAPSAITRLLELGVPYYLIRSTLIGVIAQRLVRTLCPHCAKPQVIDEADWKGLLAPWKAPLPEHARQPEGCLECRNTGFRGRAGIYEIMEISPAIRDSISPETNLEAMRRRAYTSGMRPLRISGMLKVTQGLTTIEEVLKVSPEPLGGAAS